jgi:hypothetical protein
MKIMKIMVILIFTKINKIYGKDEDDNFMFK